MISSTQNALIKQVRRLRRDRRAREAEGLFLVEGIQGVVAALEHGAPVQAVIYAPERLSSEVAHGAIREAMARGIRCEAVAASLFDTLSERDNPVGLLALVARRLAALDGVRATPAMLLVALHEIGDPGNLGTILRTVDGVGGDGLVLVGRTVDPFHPAAVKASAGTFFRVPLFAVGGLAELRQWCEAEGVALVATSDQAPVSYWSVVYPSPLLLLMGSEAHGLPAEQLATLPLSVRIPMQGSADSLNVGVATALLLYEVRRQRTL